MREMFRLQHEQRGRSGQRGEYFFCDLHAVIDLESLQPHAALKQRDDAFVRNVRLLLAVQCLQIVAAPSDGKVFV